MSMSLAYSAPTGNITNAQDTTTASTALDFIMSATPGKPILRNEIYLNITNARDFTATSTASEVIQPATPGIPILRNAIDNTPGKCCSSDLSKRCCPYDYDGNKCAISDNRTLCGYNKNQAKPVVVETTTVKYGLNCWSVNDRLECGYDKGFPQTELVTQETITNKIITTSATSEITTTDTTTNTETTTDNVTTTPTPETTTATAEVITEATDQTSTVIRDISGNCCSSNSSKKCCPYDYDDSKCEISDNRTVCGYNKNPKTPENNEATTQFTKEGLRCQVKDERVECGYSRGSDDTDPPSPTKPSRNEKLDKKENPNIHETITTATEETSTTTEKTKTTYTRPLVISVKTKSTTKRPRQRRTTIECVEIHSKTACRVILLDEDLDYD